MHDLLSNALMRSISRDLSVADLIRTTDLLRQNGQAGAIEGLYATWLTHNQDHPLGFAVLFNYSVHLSDLGKLAEAKDCLDRALAQNPEFVPALINLGRLYERLGAADAAVAQWTVALGKLAPVTGANLQHKLMALNQLARVLEGNHQDDAAEDALRQSLELDGHQREVIQHYLAIRQRQCKWPVVLPAERVPREVLLDGISPLSIAAYTDDPLLQLATADHYHRAEIGDPDHAWTAWPVAEANPGPLRVGYLSSDLREHAVGYLFTEIPGLHDRAQVEVFSYYCGPAANDGLHAHFKATSDHFVDIAPLTDAAAAERIASDGIQILVDLNGYTREARLKLVALRPAPVIVNWLGYPGTMASPYHQYLIADDTIVPPDHELYYAEKVVRLPCYQPNNRRREVGPPPRRADQGLPDEAMVYCCFNGAHKITPFTFARWLTILSRVPGSVLWLLDAGAPTNQRLREAAAQRGLDPSRLIFAPKLANRLHLARYPLADLFLDTAPYGAHTTASDALFMGVPVLTALGRSFASRVCGSLVRAAGLPEMACASLADYEATAVALGLDRERLAPLRQRLRDAHDRCPLFDMPLMARRLEGLYLDMWKAYRDGFRHQPDLANLSTYLDVGKQINPDQLELQAVGDYHGFWRALLTRRHQRRPVPADRRLCRDLG
jgi:predicted O-linked N-acetylglucosamine transferase (SPINDLY family)